MKTPVHPGEILREDVLADLGLGVGEAASRLGISRVALSRVLHGHARVSPNLAVRLEEAGVGTARAWLASGWRGRRPIAPGPVGGSPRWRRAAPESV
jgi:addiction module HigA family antidote